jgi:secreted Zn-dependent insulinase-like peptidase
MKKDSVEREVTAVNSEFEMSRISDSVRKYQIIQEALMKPGHPQGNFMWGNKISLIEDLKKRNESAYDLLHKWYPNNYSANWMNLAIQSGISS